MELRVECSAGETAAAQPLAVWFGSRRVAVRGVLDRWYGADQSWWKVDTAEGAYVLRFDERSRVWDLAAVVGR